MLRVGDLRRVRPAARPARARPEQHRHQPARLAAPRARRFACASSYGGRLPPVPPEREAITAGQQVLSEVAHRARAALRVQPPLLLVSAEQRLRLCHGPHPGDRAARVHRARQRHSRPADAGRRRRRPAASGVHVPGAAAGPVPLDRGEPVRAGGRRPKSRAGRRRRATMPPRPRDCRGAGEGVFYDAASVELWSQPRQTDRARDLLDTTTDIMRFYGDLVDDLPFPSAAARAGRGRAARRPQPGVLRAAAPADARARRSPGRAIRWRSTTSRSSSSPTSWRTSSGARPLRARTTTSSGSAKGFAQYFALLYAQKVRSKESVAGIFRQMHRSALEVSDQGPIWLGYRLGHMKSDSRVFRATVYNKSALVLHMLRRLMGEVAFSAGPAAVLRPEPVPPRRHRRPARGDGNRVRAPARALLRALGLRRRHPGLRTSWEQVELATAGADGQAPGGSTLRLILEQGPQRPRRARDRDHRLCRRAHRAGARRGQRRRSPRSRCRSPAASATSGSTRTSARWCEIERRSGSAPAVAPTPPPRVCYDPPLRADRRPGTRPLILRKS